MNKSSLSNLARCTNWRSLQKWTVNQDLFLFAFCHATPVMHPLKKQTSISSKYLWPCSKRRSGAMTSKADATSGFIWPILMEHTGTAVLTLSKCTGDTSTLSGARKGSPESRTSRATTGNEMRSQSRATGFRAQSVTQALRNSLSNEEGRVNKSCSARWNKVEGIKVPRYSPLCQNTAGHTQC